MENNLKHGDPIILPASEDLKEERGIYIGPSGNGMAIVRVDDRLGVWDDGLREVAIGSIRPEN